MKDSSTLLLIVLEAEQESASFDKSLNRRNTAQSGETCGEGRLTYYFSV